MDGNHNVTEFRKALGGRLRETVGKFPTKSAASAVAGVTVEQLNKWIDGTVKVPVESLWRLADAAGVDFCWLCAGREHDHGEVATIRPTVCGGRVIQEAALMDVLSALAVAMADDGVVFAPDRFGDLVLALHDYLVIERRGAAADLGALRNVIRLAGRTR